MAIKARHRCAGVYMVQCIRGGIQWENTEEIRHEGTELAMYGGRTCRTHVVAEPPGSVWSQELPPQGQMRIETLVVWHLDVRPRRLTDVGGKACPHLTTVGGQG